MRKFKISDLSGYLSSFDPSCKGHFADLVNNTPAHSAYDTIENNRQALAHRSSLGMTFAELEATYQLALEVLDAFDLAISISPPTSIIG